LAPLRAFAKVQKARGVLQLLIPAKAGTQEKLDECFDPWVPAFAGMSGKGGFNSARPGL